MKRILASLSAFPFMGILAWVGGYDFDTSGFWVSYLLFLTTFCSCLIYSYPGWKK